MPDYRVPDEPEGLLPWDWAVQRLVPNRNYWVTTVSQDARPHSMPVWGVWMPDDSFWFSCGPTSLKARNLASNPAVVVAIESTVEVVSIEGKARLVNGDAVELNDVINAYTDKYVTLDNPDPPAEELADFLLQNAFFAVTPELGFGIIERPDEFSAGATRWRWV